MSWGMVAVGTGAVLSAVISSDAAGDASGDASKASEASMAFEQAKYDDWKDTYGTLQDNLADYYTTLTPEYYEVQGLQAFEQEQTLAFAQIESSLAQRGIQDSGIALATELAFASEGAAQRATIRTQAPAIAADEQSRFLRIGLGQNPGESYSRALSQRSTELSGIASAANVASQQATTSAITTVGTGLADYFNRPKPATATPTTTPPPKATV